MENFLLFSKQTSKTGKTLADFLNIASGTDLPKDRIKNLIRWGSTRKVIYKPNKVFNKRAALNLTIDKYNSLIFLKKKGVSVPAIVPLTNTTIFGFSYPALARNINHSKGTDIILCLQTTDAEKALQKGKEFLIEYIPTLTEYRIHVFNNNIIKISEKILTDELKTIPWIRNLENGYTFRKVKNPCSELTEQIAKQAVKALNLDFGAVDVIVGDNGFPFVLEINSGPGLVPSGIKKYGRAFAELLKITELNESVLDTTIDSEIEENEDG